MPRLLDAGSEYSASLENSVTVYAAVFVRMQQMIGCSSYSFSTECCSIQDKGHR